jgi:DNA repair protein RadA
MKKEKQLTPDEIASIELEDVAGIGTTLAKKLREAGIDSPMELAVSSADDLAIDARTTKEAAISYILSAQKLLRSSSLLDKELMTATEVLEKRNTLLRLTTGFDKLDKFLLGGIETQAVTELYGEFGSGKSQICHQLCINVTLPLDKGGLAGNTIYIDSEGTFRPERIFQMCKAANIDHKWVLDSVAVFKPLSAANLELLIKDITKYIKERNVKLIIIDSVTSLHRADYLGRGTLAERQQKIISMLHKLLRIVDIYNIAVVVTNQVVADPAVFYGDPVKPVGGHTLAHSTTYRIYLKKAGKNRIARMVDSPYHPAEECLFSITEKGISEPY